jgi:hypothetical protein
LSVSCSCAAQCIQQNAAGIDANISAEGITNIVIAVRQARIPSFDYMINGLGTTIPIVAIIVPMPMRPTTRNI